MSEVGRRRTDVGGQRTEDRGQRTVLFGVRNHDSALRGRLRLPARSPRTVGVRTQRSIRLGPRTLLIRDRRARVETRVLRRNRDSALHIDPKFIGAEVGGQETEVGSRRSDVGRRRSEDGGLTSEARGQKTEVSLFGVRNLGSALGREPRLAPVDLVGEVSGRKPVRVRLDRAGGSVRVSGFQTSSPCFKSDVVTGPCIPQDSGT
ncbi:hypothetical protein GALL_209130 [mine drainage metagenome]|uniref:Uncharacterized protein n=1 Tax=mine drainage metagenome TaxID=410659 RepID=A0A1J5RLL0_9ZZZZ